MIPMSFGSETKIDNRNLRVFSIKSWKAIFYCDKTTPNEAETIFKLFIYMTALCLNWCDATFGNITQPDNPN
jgi:hypothetical protein